MPRLRLALMIGLLSVGSAVAQAPGDEPLVPRPTPVLAEGVAVTTVPMDPGQSSANDWRFWVNADYTVGWLKGKNLPILVTTSPPTTPQASAGVLGLTNTMTLIGGAPISEAARSGGRFGMGLWFDREKTLGADVGFFLLEGKGGSFVATSDGTSVLARPFTDAVTGTASTVLVGFPGVSSGSVNVSGFMKTYLGANLDLREAVVSESWFRLESLIGYRYLRYGESLDIQQNLVTVGGVFIPGTTLQAHDAFHTKNDFHAGEFGFRSELFRDRFSLELLTKMAVGHIRRNVVINGNTLTTVPGAATTSSAGGVYALLSNIGTHNTTNWTIAPEVGATFGYDLTSNIRVRIGYTYLLLRDVARAADQIDFTLNQNLFPPVVGGGPNRPVFAPAKSDLWMQSFNFGVEMKF